MSTTTVYRMDIANEGFRRLLECHVEDGIPAKAGVDLQVKWNGIHSTKPDAETFLDEMADSLSLVFSGLEDWGDDGEWLGRFCYPDHDMSPDYCKEIFRVILRPVTASDPLGLAVG